MEFQHGVGRLQAAGNLEYCLFRLRQRVSLQSSDKKKISLAEWESKLAGVTVRKEDMNKLVMNFLVTEARPIQATSRMQVYAQNATHHSQPSPCYRGMWKRHRSLSRSVARLQAST